mmetsp:Transcript_61309/g.138778  ORF Transcript_61309/g.138778 Transcript_61309/m.138778 type:complete len:120 (-) Transcript_61309:357-716(-)
MVSGLEHGKGKFTSTDGSVWYKGDWVAGKKHGFGQMRKVSGGVYEGDWESDLEHGLGKFTFSFGATFEGEYVMGQEHGYGIYTKQDGTIVHDGQWEFGSPVALPRSRYALNSALNKGKE